MQRRYRIGLIMPGVNIFYGDHHYTQYYDAYDKMSELVNKCDCGGFVQVSEDFGPWRIPTQEEHFNWY